MSKCGWRGEDGEGKVVREGKKREEGRWLGVGRRKYVSEV